MSRRRILVADDDPMTRKVLSTVLDLEEFEVILAQDGTQALDLLLTDPPDAAVLDQMMPGLTGLEVLARLRTEQATADLPVVILTAMVEGSMPTDPIAEGAQAHLAKPFSPLHLIEVLEGMLGETR